MAVSQSFIFGGKTGETPESLAKKRKIADALASSALGAPKNVGEGLTAIGRALMYRSMQGKIEAGETAGREKANSAFSGIADILGSGPAYPESIAAGGSTTASAATGVASGEQVAPEIRDGIVQTASALGIDPVDLGTAISYETAGTFDPRKKGPRTQWGQHEGLIQFGEPQAKQYGVDWDNPVGSQLGENGAVAKYLRDAGVKPGMGMLDIYSAINAGRVGKYNASDANNGGAPGTVADKVRDQMARHRAKAMALLGDIAQKPVQVASLDPSAGMASYAPATAEPPAAAAINQVAPVSPGMTQEQVVDGQRKVAESMGYVDGQPVAEQPQGVGVANIPAGSGGTPVLDVTQQPQLSTAAGIPFEGATPGVQKVASVLPAQAQPTVSPGISKVSNAMLAVNDQMLGGALAPQDQQQPVQVADNGGYFPPAPDANRAPIQPQGNGAFPQAPQGGDRLQRLMQAASDPWLNDQQRGVINMAIEREYEAADPIRKLQIEKAQLEINAMKTKPVKKYDNITTPDGTVLRWDPEAGVATPIYRAGAKPTSDIQEYEYAKERGFQGTFPEYQQTMKKAGATNVNTTVGGEGEGKDFYKKLDEKNADMFSTLQSDGVTARTNLVRIGQLDQILANVPTGMEADFKRIAGNYGIKTEGLDNIQAAQALINQIVPQQRPPGSGAMSDADLELFKQSVPRIINSPGGNRIIIDTMKAIAGYTAEQGNIASAVADRKISPAEGRERLATLKNPLADYFGPKKITSKEQMDALPSGTDFIAPDGTVRRKP